MKQCLACGGTFEPIGRDGVRYFHACPPITGVTVTRAGEKTIVPLVELKPGDLLTVQRGKAVIAVLPADLLEGDFRLGDVALPRPNARNENIDLAKVKRATTEDGARVTGTRDEDLMVSVGAGVIDV